MSLIKKSVKCIVILFITICLLANNAEAKEIKVISFPKKMEVGQKKTIKANQVVKWSSLNRNIVIKTKKEAKKVTIIAKKKGVGVLVAKRGKEKVTLKIKIRQKAASQNTTEQKEGSWEDAMRNGGKVYIIALSENIVKFATVKEGSFSKYLTLDDTIEIIKDGQTVSKESLQVGQCVKVDYEYHEDMVGGKLWGCKSITILE